MKKHVVCWIVVAILGVSFGANEAQLAYDYYQSSCPNVEAIVWRELVGIVLTDITSPAAFLRLMFHDCQVQGCDASILLDSHATNTSEMNSGRNYSIRKREAINLIKSALENECPGQVSCADIIALAAKMSVALTGGPRIQIPLGRRDSTTCDPKLADLYLPSPTISVDGLLSTFMGKGMNVEESVAILGSHTLGVGHCRNIVGRLNDRNPRDIIEEGYEAFLRAKCGTKMSRQYDYFVFNDPTPLLFDNQYYLDILAGKGLFPIDANMSVDQRTAPIVRHFASDVSYFFQVYSSAFVKLSSTNVLPRWKGEVRRKCNQIN